MDATLLAPRTGSGAPTQLVRAWRSLQRVELGWFVLMGLGYGLTDLGSLADLPAGVSPWPTVARLVLIPLLASLILVPFWLPATRHPASGPARTWLLAGAALAGAMAGMALLWPLVRWLQWPTVGDLMRQAKGHPMFSEWQWGNFAGDVLTVFLPAALAFLLFDLVGRRRENARRLHELQAEQQCLAREALAARLAALQAQLEPQFLFDALVDIEQAYARAGADAAPRLDALIRHLRVALPRLRDGSTTLATETELLASWLAVAQHRLPVPATLHVDWPPALGMTPLPPMLLLPLLQAAFAPQPGAAAAGPTAPTARLEARADGGGFELTLALEAAAPCPSAETLRDLAERAQAAWWCPLTLRCDGAAGSTRFVLRLACTPSCG